MCVLLWGPLPCSIIQCLKTVASCSLPSFLVVYDGKVSLIPVTLLWLEPEKSSTLFFFFLIYSFIYLFIYLFIGCVGSSLLHAGFL